MDILNNREISIGIWLSIFIVWAMTKSDVREVFKECINVFLVRQIAIPFLCMLLYTVGLIFILNEFGLWEFHQIKNSIFWLFSVAIVSFFRVNEIAKDPHYFRNTLKDNFEILIVLHFIISVYTFSLLTELFFVPFVALIVAMLAISQSKKEHKAVESFLNRLMGGIGIFIIGFTIYKLATNFGEFAKEETFYDFIVPTLLSVFILPYFFLLSLYVNYENIFSRLQSLIEDIKLLRYAKIKSMMRFNFRISVLKRWANNLATARIDSKQDIDKSIDELYELISIENNPPDVPFEEGWSPYSAMRFLTEEGLETGYYKHSYDNEWFASSPYLEVGEGILANNIAYYIEGDSSSAKMLKLNLNINNLEQRDSAHQRFFELTQKLCSKAIGKSMPNILIEAILNCENKEEVFGSKKLVVIKDDWPSNGYGLRFAIENI